MHYVKGTSGIRHHDTVLMLNGRYDFVEPVETAQRPMVDLLGTPPADKRHVTFDTGHAVVSLAPMI